MIKITIFTENPMPPREAALGGIQVERPGTSETEITYLKSLLAPAGVEAIVARVREKSGPPPTH